MSFVEDVKLALNDLGWDAWGRPKMIVDKSLFSSLFTFQVPSAKWVEKNNGAVQPSFNLATVSNGKLNLASDVLDGDVTRLESFKHPQYQPNRGHLYSTAVFCPVPTAEGCFRRWGLFNDDAGVFFELRDNGLYAVIRTTAGGVNEDAQLINTSGIDLSKGHVYDIQYQWRGVGNYKFYIDLQLVYEFELLGTLTELSMNNPALPAAFEAEAGVATCVLQAGCVDVTTESGTDLPPLTAASIATSTDSGQVSITGLNVPIIALRSKASVSSLINTRDSNLFAVLGYGDQKAVLRLWKTRDFTAITPNGQSWQDFGDGHLEYIEYDNPDVATPMTFDTAKAELKAGTRINIDDSARLDDFNTRGAEFLITPGDMVVITIHRENAGAMNAGGSIIFGEQI